MLERLTKTNSLFINIFFESSLIYLLVSSEVNIWETWRNTSRLISAVVKTNIVLALWAMVLGLYRLCKH